MFTIDTNIQLTVGFCSQFQTFIFEIKKKASFVVLRGLYCVENIFNTILFYFQHSKRNSVSPRGHEISSQLFYVNEHFSKLYLKIRYLLILRLEFTVPIIIRNAFKYSPQRLPQDLLTTET